MDIFAHGLWTNAAAVFASRKRRFELSRRNRWISVIFGVAPDFVSFGPFVIANLTRFDLGQHFSPLAIPEYVRESYNLTHSFVIFLTVLLAVWAIRKKIYWPMFGWGLHIAIDIFSHTDKFFPTPFLYPVSNFHISGLSWGSPAFMAINYGLLIAVYIALRSKYERR